MEQFEIYYSLVELIAICLAYLIDGPIHAKIALFNPYGTLTNTLNLLHRVRHEQNGNITAFNKMLNTPLALLLKENVADRKCLVDDQDIRLGNRSDCKRNTRNHTRRKVLKRHISEIIELSEINYLIEIRIDEFFRIT